VTKLAPLVQKGHSTPLSIECMKGDTRANQSFSPSCQKWWQNYHVAMHGNQAQASLAVRCFLNNASPMHLRHACNEVGEESVFRRMSQSHALAKCHTGVNGIGAGGAGSHAVQH
jgi:hypothetical protein